MRLILHYVGRYKALVLLNILSVFGFALAELGIPTVVADMIDTGVANADRGYLLRMGGVIALISVVGVAGTILLGFCCAKISTSVTRDIRRDIFDKVQTFSPAEFHKFGISSLITRTNNDAFQIQLFVNVLLRTALLTPVMLVVSFALTIRTSVALSLIILATIPLIVIGVVLVARISGPISEKQQASLDALNRISRENLSGIRVIRAFNNDDHERVRFAETNAAYTALSKRLFKLMSVTQPIFFFLMNLAALAIFWVAATLISSSQMQVGQLVAFMDYLFHAMFSFMLFCLVFMMYPRAQVSSKRIAAVLESEGGIPEKENGLMPEGAVGSLAFEHVTFVYPDGEEPVLRDVSFEARAGQTVAFIGSTGSGKSTLVQLLPRFYDVTEGRITLDGRDIRDYDLRALRGVLGFIPQKATLFSGTIGDNLRHGKPDATEKELMDAARDAQALDFIEEKGGFDQPVTEGGTNLSGGQKQRLCIARALVRRAPVYVFDDSFSALDFETDARLRRALKERTREAIVLIVAQRVSSIMDADRILVLDEGRVVGAGRHRELLQTCPVYREIAASQLSEAELNPA